MKLEIETDLKDKSKWDFYPIDKRQGRATLKP